MQDIIKQIESYDVGGGSTPTATKPNAPIYEGTGLIPVYYNGTSWVDLTSSSTADEWNKWYDYDAQNWANARTADGSMWVWIPRYEYKINASNNTIAVNFIEGTSTTTTSGYTLHPAFSTDIDNGGWDKNLEGFWVAKYAAGWQNGTQGESTKTVDYSNLTYTTVYSTYRSNYVDATVTVGTTEISYPVFKANTYAYNLISVGDASLLSKEIAGASRYGLTAVDSHLEKNSEWGAVAYLTHSKYGLNGAEVEQNKKNLSNSIDVYNTSGTKANIYAVTSYGEDADTANNTAASSTANMSGVFDLSGCVLERTATFLKGGAASTPAWHSAMADANTTASTKYVTLYEGTYDTCNKIGDAVKETSTSGTGSTSWNGDYSSFVSSTGPVFSRGGNCNVTGTSSGLFFFHGSTCAPYLYDGFRVVLVP